MLIIRDHLIVPLYVGPYFSDLSMLQWFVWGRPDVFVSMMTSASLQINLFV